MKKSGSGLSLFLTELLIDLVLFVICAAVCVGLLVQARRMSLESTRLTQAVYIAQDAAERWRSGGTVFDRYYADGLPVTAPDLAAAPDYVVTLTQGEGSAQISVSLYSGSVGADHEPIYTLTVGRGTAP